MDPKGIKSIHIINELSLLQERELGSYDGLVIVTTKAETGLVEKPTTDNLIPLQQPISATSPTENK